MSRTRTRLRDEFPRGWWRSARWWFDGLREMVEICAVAFLPLLFAAEVHRLVHHRDDPRAISTVRGTTEAWVGALLVNVSGGVAMLVAGVNDWPPALVVAGAAWFVLSSLAAAVVLVVIAHSRLRHRAAWAQLDFVADYAPKNGRPPETTEEYQALRLRTEHEQSN